MSTSASTPQWPPHLVAATIVEQDGKFLLVYENDNGRHVYNQPAGHWDEGESLCDAAQRETLEETGWEVSLTHIVGQYLYRSQFNNCTYFRTAFAAQPVRKVSDKLDKEIIAAVWMDYAEILAKRDEMRSPLVIRVIDDYLAGQHYPLSLVSYVR